MRLALWRFFGEIREYVNNTIFGKMKLSVRAVYGLGHVMPVHFMEGGQDVRHACGRGFQEVNGFGNGLVVGHIKKVRAALFGRLTRVCSRRKN